VVNPLLWGKAIQSLVGVPLIAGNRVVGVLHVGSLSARKFTSQDVELLQLAASRAALAVQSQTARDDRIAAGVLQRSLLPAALPDVGDLEIAARYVPGTGVVGGDWYDVFGLPGGDLGVVIGDVAGSGLPAAVIMGRMRSVLRGYVLDSPDPADVLGRLDRNMLHFEPEVVATVLYAVFPQALDHVNISTAGHLPPVIASPGKPAELTSLNPDLMIGVDPDVERHTTTVEFRRARCCASTPTAWSRTPSARLTTGWRGFAGQSWQKNLRPHARRSCAPWSQT
jgi:serine phosphatase RsbU (regulator of sigma subunit)